MSGQMPGGYPPVQQNQPNQGNPMYNQQMMQRMQQPVMGMAPGYGQGPQYPGILGQPGPQMTALGTGGQTQPRSPMVHSLQAQGPTTGQPSPLAGGPHSHLGPPSIGHGGPHSIGPHSVHGAPSTGPGSVLGPHSVPSSAIGGPHSLNPGSVIGGPNSVIGGPLSTGGPSSVLGMSSTGPLSNLAPHSAGGPLSVQGGPASAGDFLGNPQSIQVQQPMSVPRTIEDPRSVGPHSVNQPATPMNPASAQMPASHTPATPGQALKQESFMVDQSILTASDPVTFAKDLILKDLRYSILKYNSCVADYIRERRGEGVKTPAQTKDEFSKASDTLIAILDDCENSLTVALDASKQADRLEKSVASSKEKVETPMQVSITHKNKAQDLIKNAIADLKANKKKLRDREQAYESQQFMQY